jgi:hypothetical protein
MNIQYRNAKGRLGVTNIGEFRPGEVKLVPPHDERVAKLLIERSNGDYIETALAPGLYSLTKNVVVDPDAPKKSKKKD